MENVDLTTTMDTLPIWVGQTIALFAFTSVLTITILSSDNFITRIFLLPEQILMKRYYTYQYLWSKCFIHKELLLNYYVNSINNTNNNNNNSNTTNGGGILSDTSHDEFEKDVILLTDRIEIQELVHLIFITKELTQIRIGRIGIDRRTNVKKKDGTTIKTNPNVHYIWLYHHENNNNNNTMIDVYQLPIRSFCHCIQSTIEEQLLIFTGVYCFIMDNSYQIGSNMICDILSASCSHEQIHILQQPYWLLCYATYVLSNNNNNNTNNIENSSLEPYTIHDAKMLLYTLMRLEAVRLFHTPPAPPTTTSAAVLSTSSTTTSTSKTILVTVPSGLVPILLPMIQRTFPEDKHIFSYTGCIETVQYATTSTSTPSSVVSSFFPSRHSTQMKKISKHKIPDSLDEALTFHYRPNNKTTANHTTVSSTVWHDPVPSTVPFYFTPLQSKTVLLSSSPKSTTTTTRSPEKTIYLYDSVHMNKKKYPVAITTLSSSIASIVETWMVTMDIFFKLKHLEMNAREKRLKLLKKKNNNRKKQNNTTKMDDNDDEEKNLSKYVPYVFKLDLLLSTEEMNVQQQKQQRQIQNNNNYNSLVTGMDRVGRDRYLLVRSLIQYVTGSKSREVSTECMDAAISWLLEYDQKVQVEQQTKFLPDKIQKDIQNVVFQHKLILISDKTIQDTILPTHQWLLINTNNKKSGCACCGPEDDDDDDEDDDDDDEDDDDDDAVEGTDNEMNDNNNKEDQTIIMNTNSSFHTIPNPTKGGVAATTTMIPPPSTKFVDGRMGFAFDPSRFSN